MVAFGIGPLPGTDFAQAADIVMGETGDCPHVPQLPARGLGFDAVGRTAALLSALGPESGISLDRGPRSWVLRQRPQLLTRRTQDGVERDLDMLQEVWGEDVPVLKTQVLGPWSLAAAVELDNGHRVLTDVGAVADLHAILREAITAHKRDLARRFRTGADKILVQLDEPLLPAVLAGKVPGTTDFDPIRAVPEEVALARLQEFDADFVHAAPLWGLGAAAETWLCDFQGLDAPRHLDGLGEHLEGGRRVGLGLDPAGGDARQAAIAVARHWNRMQIPQELLSTQVDVYPARVRDAHQDYAFAAEVARILSRDAGDL